MERELVTLTGFILSLQQNVDEATGDFSILVNAIGLACKAVSTAVRKAGILNLYGMEGSVNVQGEEVKKLDIIAHDNFVSALRLCTKAGILVSEEVEEPIILGKGKYCVCFDPLDGSSNIDCNVSTGSIVAIYKRENPDAEPTIQDALRPGKDLEAALYCMYGSSTQMVLTFGTSVHLFTLDPSVGEFILTSRDMQIPSPGKKIFSCNEGNTKNFDDAVKTLVARFKEESYSARYVGSMVSDLHRTLLYNGVFMYPAAPKPKLRLLYEANPMSLIIENAGGVSVAGKGKRILDIVPTEIHERVPIFVGGKRDLAIVEEELAKLE
ncbi:Fructose-1,6-bisphosphatase 1 [Hondaea fermentalgiana]|uniref:fructose-bisphosphatase n=1 Tax=Hondaea fermentalgiana TaxID=2315210 RepID=A0A2R5GNU6_9STRA|nr:Fructose-1,6-bisphosphatase 1 [Hondaea fermentalgiana]|eukprot:GBG30303.1 Fructose-1,6-bisphosphatase 1 [Hondaea fermentalgiana]